MSEDNDTPCTTFAVVNKATRRALRTYRVATREAALNALARDAGYLDHADACSAILGLEGALDVVAIVDSPEAGWASR